MTLRTTEAKGSNASRIYDLLIFSASLCVKGAHTKKVNGGPRILKFF